MDAQGETAYLMRPGEFHSLCRHLPRRAALATRTIVTTSLSDPVTTPTDHPMTDTHGPAIPASNPEPDAPAPCGLFRRLLIMTYDLLPAVGVVFLAAVIALPLTGDRVRLGIDVPYTLYILGAWFLYLGACWTWSGQTLGMRAWQVEIVDMEGRRPGWKTSGVRFVASLLALLPLGLGFWIAAFRPDKAAWHDRVSGTRLRRRPHPGKS